MSLNPEGTLIPQSHVWAAAAFQATFGLALIFVLTYLISYRRYSKKILEGVESDSFNQPWYRRASTRILCAVLLLLLQRASYYFIGKRSLAAARSIGFLSQCTVASGWP